MSALGPDFEHTYIKSEKKTRFQENTMRTPVLVNILKIQLFAVSLLFTLLIAPSIVAQSLTGTIQGTVVDVNGAVVSGADVEIKNHDTGVTKNLTTNEDGRFNALQLQPGNYLITVSKSGFAPSELNTALTVGQTLTPSFELKPSSVQGTVTVTTTPTVDAAKTE